MILVVLRKSFLIFLFVFTVGSVFAQSDAFKHAQDSVKAKDNLSEWIYQRLDYVYDQPQAKLSIVLSIPKECWRKPKSTEEKLAWLNYLNTQGYYQLLAGKILDAINSYEAAFSFFEKDKVKLQNYDIVEYTLKPLSNNYTRLGDYERALFLQQKSIALLKERNDKQNQPALYCNLAISYRSMGNLLEAEKCVKTGLKIAHPKSEITILLNNIYADLLVDLHKFMEAKKLITLNITKQKNTNTTNAYWLMGAFTTAGNVALKLNYFDEAELNYSKALALLNKFYPKSRIREKANLFTQLGITKLAEHKVSVALQYFKSTLRTLKITGKEEQIEVAKIYGDNKLMEVFEQMSEAYRILDKPDESLKYLNLALSTADKIRNEFADDKTKERLQAETKSMAEKAIELCYQRYAITKSYNYLKSILTISEASKNRTLLDQIRRNQKLLSANTKDSLFVKKQNLERAIMLNIREEVESKQPSKAIDSLKFEYTLLIKRIVEKYKQFNLKDYTSSISDKFARFPSNKLLEYFVGNNAIYLIEIKNRKINKVEKIENAAEIKIAIADFNKTYFQNGPDAMQNNPEKFFFASNSIYKKILQNITFTKDETITIIPDDVLGYISFDGLITSASYSPQIASWPFLIKKATLAYAFSIESLLTYKQKRNNTGFTGLFITHQNKTDKPLLAVEKEAKDIKKIINGKFIFNKEVTSASFNRAFEQSTILHIGTHAYLFGNNAEPTLDFDNEKVYLFELATKKTMPSLVVLSACKTADGILANGEGIISLSRGFTAIGTSATIAGLWNVNDDAASIITTSFYRHVLAKQNNVRALHLAKKDWLNTEKNADAMYLPYFWDSLIYMGTDQTIPLKKSADYTLLLIISMASLLSAATIFHFVKKKIKID